MRLIGTAVMANYGEFAGFSFDGLRENGDDDGITMGSFFDAISLGCKPWPWPAAAAVTNRAAGTAVSVELNDCLWTT